MDAAAPVRAPRRCGRPGRVAPARRAALLSALGLGLGLPAALAGCDDGRPVGEAVEERVRDDGEAIQGIEEAARATAEEAFEPQETDEPAGTRPEAGSPASRTEDAEAPAPAGADEEDAS